MEEFDLTNRIKDNSRRLLLRRDTLSNNLTPFGLIQTRKSRLSRAVNSPEEFLLPDNWMVLKDLAENRCFEGIRNLVIATGDLRTAEKAACFFGDYKEVADWMREGEDEDFYYSEEGNDVWEEGDVPFPEECDSLRGAHQVIRLGKGETMAGNPYALETSLGESDSFCIFALENTEDLELKLDAIRSARQGFAVTLCHEKDLDLRQFKKFLSTEDALVLHLKEPEREYYLKVMDELLGDTGISFDKSCSKDMVLTALQRIYGETVTEEQILYHMLRAAENPEVACGRKLLITDFDPEAGKRDTSARQELEELIGLGDIKEVMKEFAALVRERRRNVKLMQTHSSMVFYGNPGTGKSTVADITARIMSEEGLGSGTVVRADRSSLIGKFVGHTAVKVREKFNEARGGVLFVDEAGFFTQTDTGGFVREAIKEFVRYMEEYPDVTVIFAMYERELPAFLELDEGLSSRIGRLVKFSDYTTKELSQIAGYMFEKNGYRLGRGALAAVDQYLHDRKKSFGNARGVRKLVEAAITSRAVRAYEEDVKSREFVITAADVRMGAGRLSKESGTPATKVGFKLADNRQMMYGECG